MLGGAESRSVPETCERWFEGDAIHRFAQFGVRRVLGVLENGRPNILETNLSRRAFEQAYAELGSSRSATRRLTVEVGILRRRAASEKTVGFDNLRENHQ